MALLDLQIQKIPTHVRLSASPGGRRSVQTDKGFAFLLKNTTKQVVIIENTDHFMPCLKGFQA